MKNLKEADLAGKKVLYRPDYNVPLKDGVIQDDYRITATFPTIDYLIKQKCRIIIASHLGRPDGKENPEFDLRPIAIRLADQYENQVVRYAHSIKDKEVSQAIEQMNEGDILLLPNVRYYPEEEANGAAFAKSLAGLAEVYVNDAFACDHRAHASIVGVPALIPGYPGFLLEKELENLGEIMLSPKKPFVVIMGGAKVSDKIEVIESLAKVADQVIIGGAMANTFLLAQGEEVGNSLVEKDKVDLAKKLIDELGDKLILPVDYVKDEEHADDEKDFSYLDLGEKTVDNMIEYLDKAKTIFWNGCLGKTEDERYAISTQEVAEYIANLKGVKSIVAGGDTVETITKLNLHSKFSFVSTGGGAALELLAGKDLPGVSALEESQEG